MNSYNSIISPNLFRQIIFYYFLFGLFNTIKVLIFNGGSLNIQDCFGAAPVVPLLIYMQIYKDERLYQMYLKQDNAVENSIKAVLFGTFLIVLYHFVLNEGIRDVIIIFNMSGSAAVNLVWSVYNFVAYIVILIALSFFTVPIFFLLSRLMDV